MDKNCCGALQADYDVMGVIGEGGMALVMRAVRRRDQKKVAVKVLQKSDLLPEEKKQVEKEIEVLRNVAKVAGDRCVQLLEVVEDKDCIYMVMDHIAGGDLFDIVTARDHGFPEREALQIVEGVLDGLVKLHAQGIVHRDIKLENIMLEDGDPTRVKLVDFGMAYWRKDPQETRLCSDRCGTPEYLTPQVVSRQSYVPEKVDMWCLGVVLHVLFAGSLPFPTQRLDRLYRAITKQEVCLEGREWSKVSESTKRLIGVLMSKDEGQRPTAAQCLQTVRELLDRVEGEPAVPEAETRHEHEDRHEHGAREHGNPLQEAGNAAYRALMGALNLGMNHRPTVNA